MTDGIHIPVTGADMAWLLRHLHELNEHLATYPAGERDLVLRLDEEDRELISLNIELLNAIHEDLHLQTRLLLSQARLHGYSKIDFPDDLPEADPQHEEVIDGYIPQHRKEK